MNYPIIFDGTDLNAVSDVEIYNYNVVGLGERQLRVNKLARSDSSILTSAEYSSKLITVNGEVCSSTRENGQAAWSTLKNKVQGINKVLSVEQANDTIEYTTTLQATQENYFGNTLVFTLEFLATDPIGKASTTDVLINQTSILESNNYAVTVVGTYYISPVLTIVINSVTGGTDALLSIRNASTGKGIVVERDWIAGDILVIDSELQTVTVNSADVDFTGTFPVFYTGSQTLQYNDSFTTRSVDVDGVYKARFV